MEPASKRKRLFLRAREIRWYKVICLIVSLTTLANLVVDWVRLRQREIKYLYSDHICREITIEEAAKREGVSVAKFKEWINFGKVTPEPRVAGLKVWIRACYEVRP